MSKIRVDTVATVDDSTNVPTATLTALPARVTAVETGKAAKGANSDITALNALTTAITLAQGGHGATTPDAARSALGVTGRNRIINGACMIAQRASTAFAAGVGGYGGPDRFYATNSTSAGGQFTQSQGTIVDGSVTKPAVVQTVGTAIANTSGANGWSGIQQPIEGFNCFDLVSSPVAISFLFKTNVTGNFSVALRDSTGSVSYTTSFAAVSGSATKVTINLPAIPSGAVVPQTNSLGLLVSVGAINTGTYQSPGSGVWNTGNYATVASSTNWGATPGNYISLTDLQLEAGTATPFERRGYTHELSLCQRYFYRVTSAIPVGMGHFRGSTTIASCTWKHPVQMRAQPSFGASSGAAFNIYTNNGAPLSTAYSTIASGTDAIWVDFTSAAAATAGWPAMLVVAGSGGSYAECNAEL